MAAEALPSLMGGGRTQVTQNASQSASVVASPLVSVVTGGGTSTPGGGSPSLGGGASATARPYQAGDTFPAFATPPLSRAPIPVNDLDTRANSPTGTEAGLFGDPMLLLILAGGAALFLFAGKKGKK